MIKYTVVKHNKDLHSILALQAKNLPAVLSRTELQQQGFLTLKHNFDLLKKMNNPYPHVIASSDEKLIGYTLVMLPSFQNEFPILDSMFSQFKSTKYLDKTLGELSYFVMGQVCIDKPFRGRGVFQGLYKELKIRMKEHFDYVITEVSKRNPRSMQAHINVGFESVKEFTSEQNEDWVILLMKLKDELN